MFWINLGFKILGQFTCSKKANLSEALDCEEAKLIILLSNCINNIRTSMTISFHIRALILGIYVLFLLQAVLLLVGSFVYRVTRLLLGLKQPYVNPFKITHQDVFKTQGKLSLM